MAAQIQESMRYSLFTSHLNNRSIRKNDPLMESMKVYGWLDAYPAHVVRESGGLRVKAGHHRVAVAIQLGIPIKYVVCDDGGVSIFELEKSANPWSLRDYLDSHCRNGNPHYLAIRSYCDAYGLPPSCVINLLAGKHIAKSVEETHFKEGSFVVRTTELLDSVVDIIHAIRSAKPEFQPTGLFVQALADVLRIKEVDTEILKRKIKLYPSLVQKHVSKKDYIKSLEDLYNRKTSVKLHLGILVAEDMQRRKDIGRDKGIEIRRERSRSVRAAAIHNALQEAL